MPTVLSHRGYHGETYKIELVEADNKSDKTEAVSAAQSHSQRWLQGNTRLYGSACPLRQAKLFAEAQVPAIGASCTNPQVTLLATTITSAFCFLDPFQGTVMAIYAVQEGAKNAAIITSWATTIPPASAASFKDAFVKLGGTIVNEEQFQTTRLISKLS